jgi:long-chain-fatty-acid--CoA ligase ACSBG
MYTGAAPIAHSTLYFFGALDLPVHELFGMSECTGPHTVARPKYFKVGTTGPNMPGVETKIEHMEGRDKPQEGEICMRGRNVMMGYMKDPVKTKESIDMEGFLHSGDVGRVDEWGCVSITGRIKELLITAGGENVAPVPVEDLVKKELPGISNAMMIGDRRKYNNILITLRTVPDEKTGGFGNVLQAEATKVDPNAKSVEEAQKSEKWKSYIEDGLKRANKQAVSNAQTVQKYAILPMDFSVPGGELTPTLKLKRNVVLEKYKDVVEALYKE